MGQSFFKKSKLAFLCLSAGACLPLNTLLSSSAEASPFQAVGTGAIQQTGQVYRQPVQYSQNQQYRQQPVRRGYQRQAQPVTGQQVHRQPVQYAPAQYAPRRQPVQQQQAAQQIPLDSVYRQAYNRAAASGYNSQQADTYARQVVAAYQRRSQAPAQNMYSRTEQHRIQRQQELAKMQANAALWNRIEQQRRQAWVQNSGYRQGVAQTNQQLQQIQATQNAHPMNVPAQMQVQQPGHTSPVQTQLPPATQQTQPPRTRQIDYSQTFSSPAANQSAAYNANSQRVATQAIAGPGMAAQGKAQPVSAETRPVSVLETAPPSTFVPPASSGQSYGQMQPATLNEKQIVQTPVPAALGQGSAPQLLAPAPIPAAQATGGNQAKPVSAPAKNNLLAAPMVSVETPGKNVSVKPVVSTVDQTIGRKNKVVKPAAAKQTSQDPLFRRTPKPLSTPPKTPSAAPIKKPSGDDMELKLEGFSSRGQQGRRTYVSHVAYQQPQLNQGFAPQLTQKRGPSPALSGGLPSTSPTFQAQPALTPPTQLSGQAATAARPQGRVLAIEGRGSAAAPTQQQAAQGFGDLNPVPAPSGFGAPEQNPNSQWTNRPAITRPAVVVKSPSGVRLKAASARTNQPYRAQEKTQQATPREAKPSPAQALPLNGNRLQQNERERSISATESCEKLRQRMKSDTLQTVTLDLNVPLAKAGAQVTGQRDWMGADGKVIATGTAVSGSSLVINVKLNDGSIRPIDINLLSPQDQRFAMSLIDLPAECGLDSTAIAARSFVPSTVTWYASNLCHKPLYFEDIQLERYGHTKGPFRQPVRSAANFLIRTALLPYQMTMHPPNECQYPLGLYRPGNCAPYLRTPFPWNRRALVNQATFVGGGISIIP